MMGFRQRQTLLAPRSCLCGPCGELDKTSACSTHLSLWDIRHHRALLAVQSCVHVLLDKAVACSTKLCVRGVRQHQALLALQSYVHGLSDKALCAGYQTLSNIACSMNLCVGHQAKLLLNPPSFFPQQQETTGGAVNKRELALTPAYLVPISLLYLTSGRTCLVPSGWYEVLLLFRLQACQM
eukprot:scaffold273756_cov18-Tisochrysis_lutea.AAC.3